MRRLTVTVILLSMSASSKRSKSGDSGSAATNGSSAAKKSPFAEGVPQTSSLRYTGASLRSTDCT